VPPEHPDKDTNAAPREIPFARLAKAPRARWYVRAGLVGIGVALVVIFGLAASIHPYGPDGAPRSMATHTQLGLPPCNFVTLTGKPCPSCGMTTSFALLVRGDIGASLRANWVGTILATTWAALLVWSVACGLTGRFLLIPRGRGELILTIVVGTFLVLLLGRWVGVLLLG